MRLKFSRTLTIRAAEPADVREIAENMREADKAEVMASSGHTPEQALEKSMHMSPLCMVLTRSGRPIAMFGVAAKFGEYKLGSAWMLGTNEIREIKKSFLVLSRVVIKHMLKEYRELFNFVAIANTESMTWLKHCGAEFAEETTGPGGQFRAFKLRRQ